MTDHWVLVALRLGIVAVGLLVSFWAFRLSILRKNWRGRYLLLAIGFGLLTLGAVVEGLLFELVGWTLSDAHTTEAGIAAAGLALVLLSILRSA